MSQFNLFCRYGSRQTTEECPEAVILMSLQSIIGVVISCCMAGIVFAKLARPKQRSHTVIKIRGIRDIHGLKLGLYVQFKVLRQFLIVLFCFR